MPLRNPDFDAPLSLEHTSVIVRYITSGHMHVTQVGNDVMLCEEDKLTGVRVLPYQMTRRGITQAVADFYPHIAPILTGLGNWAPASLAKSESVQFCIA